MCVVNGVQICVQSTAFICVQSVDVRERTTFIGPYLSNYKFTNQLQWLFAPAFSIHAHTFPPMAQDPWSGVVRVVADDVVDDLDDVADPLLFDESLPDHQQYLRYLVHHQRFSNPEIAFHLNVCALSTTASNTVDPLCPLRLTPPRLRPPTQSYFS